MQKETSAALPPSSAVFLFRWRSQGRRCAISETSHVISKVPYYDSHQRPDELKKLEVPSSRPNATFHWPPDCPWPFVDHVSNNENRPGCSIRGAVDTLRTIRKPLAVILPLNEVKRRAVCDALDKCGGNYPLAARLLGLGKTTVYRMASVYNYEPPKMQAEGLRTVSSCLSVPRGIPKVKA
jgi:Bacterial regulatory protein, Fis family